MNEFLDDTQIHELLKRFQNLKDREDEESIRTVNEASRRRGPSGRGLDRRSVLSQRQSIFGIPQRMYAIDKEEFVGRYPTLLMEITDAGDTGAQSTTSLNPGNGIDIAFQDLSLTVKVKNNAIKVVNNVTGRLSTGSMTALMGGPGAGKTSLLNALCGRAFYGEVTGDVKINGHNTSIEDYSSAVGFVPQVRKSITVYIGSERPLPLIPLTFFVIPRSMI